MKYLEMLEKILKNEIEENDTTRFIKFAYYVGAEKKCKTLVDEFNRILNKEKENANKKRYKHLINSCLYPANNFYDGDYSRTYTKTFQDDEIKGGFLK